ncbi:MAG: polysaccharide biosynthesis protein [Bacteroidales bacterium]|nr:polysaccharide biosynthesis protein [Bacteroidales bacterium]
MYDNSASLQERIRDKAIAFCKKYSVPRWLVFLQDIAAVFTTFIIAYLLRFNFITSDFNHVIAFQHAATTVLFYLTLWMTFRPHSGMIRHTTVLDIFYVFLSTTLSYSGLFILTLLARAFEWPLYLQIPISILTIHFVVVTVFLFGVRISIKTLYHLITSSYTKKRKVLIYGAGAMGVIVKRVLLSDIKGDYHIVGFLDKNRSLQGKKLNGIPVYSPASISKEFIKKHDVETMIFAIRDITQTEKSEIIRSAINMGMEVRDTPAVETWLNGELQLRQIEKVKLEDLLGREPINLNLKQIGLGLTGKTVLVTGAAGSIGSEIVRQLTRFNIKMLVLTDQAETPMFHLENELRSGYSHCPVKLILADVANQEKMESLFKEFHPEVVFHAAAYKHVPLMEENPHEAVRVNVGGTKLITKLSVDYSVKKFVMISTDKAVNPTNVMGASKRLCEMIVQLKSQKLGNKTQFIITRFGNVLGSNGSVIPIFTKQIEEGGPVTVTHPDITRYFMTIPEACQLVLEAGFMGHGGEIFVFDMGKPVKIVDLANQMIRLSGLTPDDDIKIEYTGLRPGEKLYEELLADEESTMPTHHPKIKIAHVKRLEAPGTLLQIDNFLNSLYALSKQEVVDFFKELVPEYDSNNENYNGSQQIPEHIERESVVERSFLINPYEALRRMINPDSNRL